MIRPVWLLIGSMAATLTAGLAGGMTLDARGSTEVAGIFRPRLPPAATVNATPDRPGRWAQIALSRPLFRPDRRPPQIADTAGAIGLRLTGIVISPLGRAAIFAPAGGGKPVVAGVGATVGPWTVKRIDSQAVAVAGAQGDRVLRPVFAANPRAAAPLATNAYLPGVTRLLQHGFD